MCFGGSGGGTDTNILFDPWSLGMGVGTMAGTAEYATKMENLGNQFTSRGFTSVDDVLNSLKTGMQQSGDQKQAYGDWLKMGYEESAKRYNDYGNELDAAKGRASQNQATFYGALDDAMRSPDQASAQAGADSKLALSQNQAATDRRRASMGLQPYQESAGMASANVGAAAAEAGARNTARRGALQDNVGLSQLGYTTPDMVTALEKEKYSREDPTTKYATEYYNMSQSVSPIEQLYASMGMNMLGMGQQGLNSAGNMFLGGNQAASNMVSPLVTQTQTPDNTGSILGGVGGVLGGLASVGSLFF
ncbi:hypothetical protein [Desulfovibrio inopinatus]|uniref:hypothetical protein n=1 Tax=Desulfovibrio inopinatus TaxID=102109 RepID=UPI00040BFC64|nr:hypothetical protein [Desulfovibrio inopinatus]